MLRNPKTLLISLSSLCLTSLLNPSPSYGVCVATDVSIQMSIRGSRTPAQQSNNVGIQGTDNCWGNTTTNTSTQLYRGSGTVQQQRNSSHFLGGSQTAPFGIKSPVINNQIHVPIDIYSPAHDPNFLGNFNLNN